MNSCPDSSRQTRRGMHASWVAGVATIAALLSSLTPVRAAEPLATWQDGPAKARIIEFVQAVTDPTSRDYVPPAQRVAVFDNDGTLWSEQPMYFQLAFILDRLRELAPRHPEWREQEPFKSALAHDLAGVAKAGEAGLVQLMAATHAGMTTTEFARVVDRWLATARHPRFERPYTELTYAPMRELLGYLRSNGFKTYVVSGGGVDFMRTFSERVYGIPPEQVVGSSLRTRYDVRDGQPVIERLPEIEFINDGGGKPVGIERYIGRQPILAFGNSDGDFQMLEYTTRGPGRRLGLILHHDDSQREYAYDRASHVGRLDRALNEAPGRGWTVVSMQRDWRIVYTGP
jgi:phosphoglycolate phosphatase-like HAD superfamily hydrolase